MNILMISPYFEPCTLVGALRMSSLAKFLIQTGHSVSVLKIRDEEYSPNCTGLEVDPRINTHSFSEQGNSSQIEQQLLELIDKVCIQTFDCCIVSCGPYYTIRPSIYLTEKYDIPLIVDYRDLWLYDPRPSTSLRSFLGTQKLRIFQKGLERKLMTTCAQFVTITPLSMQTMKKHYPILQGKSHCIYNGYTPFPEFDSSVKKEQKTETTDIYFLGKLSYYDRAAALLYFRAVASLRKQGYPVRIIHIGVPEENQSLLDEARLSSDAYVQLGQMSYQTALETAINADIFAAVINYKHGLGTKLFDYIYLNRPVVAIAPQNSEFEGLLAPATAGYVCQTKEQIEKSIKRIIDLNQTVLTEDSSYRKNFSRQYQNQRYLDLLLSIHNE